VQLPDDGPENVHAAWRVAVARQAAGAYTGNRNVAALAVAGSVGAGIADRFSDLELDCYWVRPPADADRLAPVRALAGELTALWDYDQDDEEWSEDYRVGELDITVSNFLVSSVERFLDDVLLRASTDPVRHIRLAALQRSRPLLGAELMASWRTRADAFPGILVAALVEQALARRHSGAGAPVMPWSAAATTLRSATCCPGPGTQWSGRFSPSTASTCRTASSNGSAT
jgi:hypothetical protein